MADTFKGIITADGKKRQLPYGSILDKPVSDETLSIQGGFADAKVVGDKFEEVKTEAGSLKGDIASLRNDTSSFNQSTRVSIYDADEAGAISSSDGSNIAYGGKVRSKYIPIAKGETIHCKYANPTTHAMIAFYNNKKEFISAVAGDGNAMEVIEEAPSNGYFRFCCWEGNATNSNYFITINDTYHPSYREYNLQSYVGSKVISGAVGEKAVFTNNYYRALSQVLIPSGCIGVYLKACRAGDTDLDICVTDKDYNILYTRNVSDKSNDTMCYVNLVNYTNARYVFFPRLQNDIYPNTTVFFDYGNYTIFDGETCPISISGVKKEGDTYHTSLVKGGSNSVSIVIGDTYAHSFAFDFRIISLDECKSAQNITIEYLNGATVVTKETLAMPDTMQTGEWVRVKTHTSNKIVNTVKVTINFTDSSVDGAVVHLEIKDRYIKNHYTKPIAIINFDHTWTATESCGAYDYLNTHNIPFTITGNIGTEDSSDPNHKEISDETMELLVNMYKDGMLDVGVYGGEKASNIYDRYVTSVKTLDERMYNIMDAKIAKGYFPVVFAPTNHLISRLMQNSLFRFGFNLVRVGDVKSGGVSFPNNKNYVTVGYGYGNSLIIGSPCVYFTHGVSANKTQEETPSLYDTWSSFKYMIDVIKAGRNNNECMIMNMRDYYNFVSSN